jgi:hypothetical protein
MERPGSGSGSNRTSPSLRFAWQGMARQDIVTCAHDLPREGGEEMRSEGLRDGSGTGQSSQIVQRFIILNRVGSRLVQRDRTVTVSSKLGRSGR